jgi:predicted ATP-grasp superfamily ATP-dependent carboligase
MRLLLIEWCCSGGLAGTQAAIAAEGRMMLEAVAGDAAQRHDLEVSVLVEAGRDLQVPSRVRRIVVDPGGLQDTLVEVARLFDWTLIVAPEQDGILRRCVAAVRAGGGRVLAPSDAVLAIASDKQATVVRLAGQGLPVPAGRPLSANAGLPHCFRLPAVRKARDGCGGEAFELVRTHAAAPATVPTRLEAFVLGIPVGVSCLCGPCGPVVLPPMRQWFTMDDSPRYRGGDVLRGAVARRAEGLAQRAVLAMRAEAGWMGVDMILGPRPDGRDDRVLEVNPRVTSSIVGQRRLFSSSLVAAMIALASAEPAALETADHADSSAGSFRLPSV